jgi:O-antigen ligase
MKIGSQVTKTEDLRPIRWILASLISVTLYFQTTLADPFNSPKLWVLLIFAAWLTGYIFSVRKIISAINSIKYLTILILVFLIFLLLATIFTDFYYVAIFGDTQRRNGFLQYLSLSIILVATAIYVRAFNIKKLFIVTYFVALILSIYSIMQTTGNDFVSWNNPYNAVIGTVGNPNFAAAVMAIMGVIIFSSIFVNTLNYIYRIFAVALSVLLLFAIYRSNARQGLLAYILGAGIFMIIWLWIKNRKLGIYSSALGVIVFIASVLGMLQQGPLEKFLYKPSVSIRGYYWRAGIEMLINYPFFGVGIDRYGAYFKEYREVKYPLTYGFDITSTNAHNTFIQFFATGGFFLGVAYLVLNGYIFKRAIYGLKNLKGNERLFLAGIFSSWIAYHSQSLISIDNIGISIWGWILGGSIVGLSVSAHNVINEKGIHIQRNRNSINLSQGVTSGLTTLVALVLVTLLYKGESSAYNATASVNLQDQNSRISYKELQLQVINAPLADPYYKLFAASRLIKGGFVEEGLTVIKSILLEDSRNLDALNLLAMTYEQLNSLPDAILYREKLAELDPWNATNYLALGKDYKAQGNLIKSKEMLEKILSFASNNPITEQAKLELVS